MALTKGGGDFAFGYCTNVHAGVTLLVTHHVCHSESKRGGCVRKSEECPRHDFERLELVVGEDVMSESAFGSVLQRLGRGKLRRHAAVGELQIIRARRQFDAFR